MPAESRSYDPYNPYEPRHAPTKKDPWWKNRFVLIGAAIIILFLVLSATGSLKFPSLGGSNNETQAQDDELTEQQQLIQYVIAQQTAGTSKEDIVKRLELAGYKDDDIETAFQLADPNIQYILTQQNKGVSKAQIVEELLKQGHTPENIQAYFAIIEKSQEKNIFETLMDNWLIVLVIIGIIIYLQRRKDAQESKKGPKVYTLEECREYAEEILKERNLDFSPCREYKNRPDLKQYRYIYQEPIFPEFNTHRPYGHRSANRQYYLIGVGYDRQLVDFRITEDDTEMRKFLYSAPRSFERSGETEYMRLRERSELPIQDIQDRERQERHITTPQPYRPRYPTRRRPTRRYTPGPIEGYEAE